MAEKQYVRNGKGCLGYRLDFWGDCQLVDCEVKERFQNTYQASELINLALMECPIKTRQFFGFGPTESQATQFVDSVGVEKVLIPKFYGPMGDGCLFHRRFTKLLFHGSESIINQFKQRANPTDLLTTESDFSKYHAVVIQDYENTDNIISLARQHNLPIILWAMDAKPPEALIPKAKIIVVSSGNKVDTSTGTIVEATIDKDNSRWTIPVIKRISDLIG